MITGSYMMIVRIITAFLWSVAMSLTAGELIEFPNNQNNFTDAEEVSFRLSADIQLRIIDRLGREKAVQNRVGGRVSLGNIPCGFYEIFDADKLVGKFAVVPGKYPNDRNSRLGVDYALATASDLPSGREERKLALERSALMAERAGVRAVRERVNLKTGIIRDKNGLFVMNDFNTQAALEAAAKAGLGVSAVFQNMPEFIGRGRGSLKTPENIFDSYAIIEAMVKKLAPFVDQWEIYNELDLRNFYEGTAPEYAAFAKAASLAIRRNAPASKVLLTSFATQATSLKELFDAVELLPYYDLANLHSYSTGRGLHSYLANGITKSKRPVHATETGVTLAQWNANDAEDYPKNLSLQTANLLGSIYAEALAAGSERAYFFIWRFYKACGSIVDVKYRATERYAALATANYCMGNANYLGSSVSNDARMHLFDNGFDLMCLVLAPTEKPVETNIPLDGEWGLYNTTGEILEKGSGGSKTVKVATGSGTRYLTARKITLPVNDLRGKPQLTKNFPAPESIVELELDPMVKYDHGLAAYELRPGEKLTGRVRVSNFSKSRISVLPTAKISGKWKVELAPGQMTVEPGRFEQKGIIITAPSEHDRGRQPALLTINADNAVQAVRLALSYGELTTMKTQNAFAVPLNELKWQPGGFARGLLKYKIQNTAAGTNFKIDFLQKGVRMFWPSLQTLPGNAGLLDWSGFDGVKLTLNVKSTRAGTWFMASLTEECEAKYNSSRIMIEEPGKVEMLLIFSDFVYFDSVPDEPLFSLDVDKIKRFGLGFHTNSKYKNNFEENYSVEYELTSAELVKY